jgi:hypothetical protein
MSKSLYRRISISPSPVVTTLPANIEPPASYEPSATFKPQRSELSYRESGPLAAIGVRTPATTFHFTPMPTSHRPTSLGEIAALS